MAAIKFSKQYVRPNPQEVDYWIDLSTNQYGGIFKYFNGLEWVDLVNPDGSSIDANDYYTKLQINEILTQKADISSVESKVDDSEVANVIKNIEFKDRGDSGIEMILLKYNDKSIGITLPAASDNTSGILTKDSFKNLVKQSQLQLLYTEIYDKLTEINQKYQKKLKAGDNIVITSDNTIHATSKTGIEWDNITNKPDLYDKKQIDAIVSGVYKIKGSRLFENLPTNPEIGDVWNILNDFVLYGKNYKQGTNVVYTEEGWDALSGIADISEVIPENYDADKTITTQKIPVAGGPLANLVSGTIGNEIPAGTDIQSLLMQLLCKVLWPTNITNSFAQLTTSVDAPVITMDTSTVEVGTSVSYTVKNGASSYTATPSKTSGFTYGYSASNDNSKDSSNTYVQATFGEVTINGDNKTTLSVSSTGNNSQSAEGTSQANSAQLSGTIVAVKGTNTCSASNTSVKHKGSCSAVDVYYGCSNTGLTSEAYKSTGISAMDNVTSSSTSNSNSKSFTGAYKYYIGYELPTDLKTLSTSGWLSDTTTLSDGGTLPAGKTMVIAVPYNYSLDSILNGFDLESKDSFSTQTKSYTLPNNTNINYTVYTMYSAAEWKYKKIVIKYGT